MYDIAIIGAGVIGACVARELSKYNLNIILLDRENDVSDGTTKANSAIVHSGYDAKEGTLMAKHNVRGNEMYEQLCKELNVPFKRSESLVVAFTEEEIGAIKELYERGKKNNVPNMELISQEEIRNIEPNLSKNIKGALLAKSAGIVGPWELTVALVENAIVNGVKLNLNSEVLDITKSEDYFTLKINEQEDINAKYIINASGIYADEIHNMVSENKHKIHPRKGQYYIMSKKLGKLVNRVIFQAPTKKGKGVLIAPTVHGNLIIGPDAEDIGDKTDLSNTREELEYIRESAKKCIEDLDFYESIRNFTGLRAISEAGDFIIEEAKDVPRFIDILGIKSPGLTAAPSIALDVVDIIRNSGMKLESKKDFNPYVERIIFMNLSSEEKKELIKKDPLYGKIVCKCERITEGEIVDSIKRINGAKTIDGVKKRTGSGMGKCQGSYCAPIIQMILARELHKKPEEIVQDKLDSYILTKETKNVGDKLD